MWSHVRRAALVTLLFGLGACELVAGLGDYGPALPTDDDTPDGGGGGAGNGGGGGPGGTGGAISPCLAPETNAPCTGDVIWSRGLLSDGDVSTRAVEAGSDGSVLLAVNANADFKIDEAVIPAGPANDGFLVKLDESGELLWHRAVTGVGTKWLADMAATEDAGAVLMISFDDDLSVEGGMSFQNQTPDTTDALLVRYDADGNVVWFHHFESDGVIVPFSIDVATTGELAVAGVFRSSMTIPGGGDLIEGGTEHDGAFLLVVEDDGAHRWAREFGGDATDENFYVASFDAEGRLVVGGAFTGELALGLGRPLMAQDGWDGVIAAFDSSAGNALWQTSVTGENSEFPVSIAACPNGSFGVAGRFDSSLVVGTGGPLVNFEGFTQFVARLDVDGSHISSTTVTGAFDTTNYFDILVCDGNDHLVLGGGFHEDLAFGATPESAVDAYVAKLRADGEAYWLRTFSGNAAVRNLALASDGSVLATGLFEGTLSIDGVDHVNTSTANNSFVVKLQP